MCFTYILIYCAHDACNRMIRRTHGLVAYTFNFTYDIKNKPTLNHTLKKFYIHIQSFTCVSLYILQTPPCVLYMCAQIYIERARLKYIRRFSLTERVKHPYRHLHNLNNERTKKN